VQHRWLALLLVPALALADGKAADPAKTVEALVRKQLADFGNTDVAGTWMKDMHVVVGTLDTGNGSEMPTPSMMYSSQGGKVTVKLGKLTVATGDGFAWFEVAYDAHFGAVLDEANTGDLRAYDQKLRVAGLAVQTPQGWKLAGLHYARPLADKDLFAPGNGGRYVPDKAELKGDAALAKVVGDWLTTGFAAHAAKTGTLIAAGSAPGEVQTGAATAKLVAVWDKMGLRPSEIQAHVFADGKVGFVIADLTVPPKGKRPSVELMLTLVCTWDGKEWRWVSLSFSA
jgi:hypothetical protein